MTFEVLADPMGGIPAIGGVVRALIDVRARRTGARVVRAMPNARIATCILSVRIHLTLIDVHTGGGGLFVIDASPIFGVSTAAVVHLTLIHIDAYGRFTYPIDARPVHRNPAPILAILIHHAFIDIAARGRRTL